MVVRMADLNLKWQLLGSWKPEYNCTTMAGKDESNQTRIYKSQTTKRKELK
jgi:hypothetical protein